MMKANRARNGRRACFFGGLVLLAEAVLVGCAFASEPTYYPARPIQAQQPSAIDGRLTAIEQRLMKLENLFEAGIEAAKVGDRRLALEGYCPVTLVEERRWELGSGEFVSSFHGQRFQFAGARQQRAFLASPLRFAPVIAGYDIVALSQRGELAAGKREHGVTYRGRIYLFKDEDSLNTFFKQPPEFGRAAEWAEVAVGWSPRRQDTGRLQWVGVII